MKLYLIEPKKNDFVYEDFDFRNEMKSSYSKCDLGHNYIPIFVDGQLINVKIQKKISTNLLFDVINGTLDMPFFNKKLIDVLGFELVNRNFYIGDLFINDKKINDFVSVFPKEHAKIRLRGYEKSIYKKCEHCGAKLYFAWVDNSEFYIIKDTFDYNVGLFMSTLKTLIVTEEILEKIKSLIEKNYKFERLEILDVPLDGFEREIPW